MAAKRPDFGILLFYLHWHSIRTQQTAMAGSTGVEKTITLAELRQHRTANSLWLAINDIVYDVTDFIKEVSYFDISDLI
jgi:cytochrome b involved in lipid metabolism